MELDPTRTAFLFPGQGSQAVGMGRELAQQNALARELFAAADQELGIPLTELAWQSPVETLNDTINAQPALLVHSIAALRVLQERLPNFHPEYVAGHSMGEISALVAAGTLPYEAALQLTRRRGELMKEAGLINPGGMAAVLGLDITTLDDICRRATTSTETVQVANDNCPGQYVISGAHPALARAMALAQEAGARRVIRLAVSIPAHSPLMEPIQEQFGDAVEAAGLGEPQVKIVGNVSARPLETIKAIREDLIAQLTSRVRWTETIQYLHSQGVTTFVEIGTGRVLSGLVKRIDRKLTRMSLGTPEDFEKLSG